MSGGIILENGTRLNIGDGVVMPLSRILEVAAAALTGMSSEGNYFLAAVKQEAKGDDFMRPSPADRIFGMYGIVIEGINGDGEFTLRLSAKFPKTTLRRLEDEGKIV